MTTTVNDFSTGRLPTWCPGCGDFGIWAALKNALSELNIEPKDAVFVYGIGCHGNMYNAFKAVNFESLHGRPLPVANGIKMANHKLSVFAVSGDGDAMGEGGNHFIHTAKRNLDITYIIHDNQVYGLTTGQTSPTSPKGFKSKTNPEGSMENPFNPLALAIAAGATFVARGFAGDIAHLTNLIKLGHKHKGFSVINVLQPCVTFNHQNTYQFYRQNVYKLDETYQPFDKISALEKAYEWEKTGKIPIGLFYEEQRMPYEEELSQIKESALTEQSLSNMDLDNIIKEFT
jgi:2-oxoglutarate ferredoxin oxidoreductase subunit beta